MKILFRFLLIIFSLSFFSCKRDATSQNQTKLTPPLSDSVVLHQADSLYDVAETITDLKKADSALNLHLRVLAIRERFLANDLRLLKSYYKVGILYWNDNKFDVADKFLENGRRVTEQVDTPNPILFDIYYYLASCKMEAKDFPTAASLSQHLIHFVQVHEPKNKALLVKAYSQVGNIYYNSNQENKAIDNWLIATQLTPSDNHERLAHLFFNISSGYSKLKQFETSLTFINKSIRQNLLVDGPDSKTLADRYLHKAFVLLGLRKMDSVSHFLQRTLQIRRRVFGEKDSYTYGIKLGIGDFYFGEGRFDSAAYYYHESLISYVRTFTNPNLFANPKPDPDELNPDLVNGLVQKAKSLEKLFDRDSAKTDLLELALNTYLLADSVLAGYRKNILHDDPLMQQMEVKDIPYEAVVGIAAKLFAKTKSEKYFEKAFHTMESSRAIVLQNALDRAVDFGAKGIADSIVRKKSSLVKLRAEILQRMSVRNLKQSTLDSLNEALLVTDNEEVDLQGEIRKINPNFFSLRYDTMPTMENLRKLMAERHSVLLEYMWSDSSIYCLVITPARIKINLIATSAEFREAFKGFIKEFHADPEGAIEPERYKSFCHNSSSLFDYLLKEPLHGVDVKAHLIISADGPLATIPFDALITHNPQLEEVNYHLPYLVLERPISYAYSAGVLLKQSIHAREGKKLLAFGYAGGGPARATRSGLTNLPGTEKEILAVKEVMKNHINQYKLQSQASESLFKQQVADFDIVHLAVHGEGDTLNALNSRLIFRTENDTLEDGSLYAHELYDLNLSKLDLAVLSACESGIGKQQTGEGLMSIARGFAYAGCPSLVISLWKINDRTSAQVMKGFYKYLSDGQPLDVALAKAKTDYINGAREFDSHPFYWAAFLQVGDVRALDVKKPNWLGWVLGLGAGGAIIFFLISWYLGSSHRKKQHY